MADTTDSLFSQLTPEQLSALLQGGTLQDKGGLLAQQLQDLMGSGMQHQEHSTPLGAGLGGIAEALDGTANAFHAKALRGDQQKNLEAQQKMMGDFGQLLRGPKDPGSEFGLPSFPQRSPSAPPMVEANADIPSGGMMQGLDIGQFAQKPQGVSPGMDLSALPEVMGARIPMPNQPPNPSEMSPEWGMDISGPANQPKDPTQVVDNGSDGWGLDMSDPKHVAAMIRGLKKGPEMLAQAPAESIHPGMPRRGPRLDDEMSPFGY